MVQEEKKLQDTPLAPSILRVWFERDIRHYANWERDVLVLPVQRECTQSRDNWLRLTSGPEPVVPEGSQEVRVRFYTESNEYSISAIVHPDGNSYLGCTTWARKTRAGEDHPRGNDLPDGPLTEETWRRILAAIVGYELVKVHRSRVVNLTGNSGCVEVGPVSDTFSSR